MALNLQAKVKVFRKRRLDMRLSFLTQGGLVMHTPSNKDSSLLLRESFLADLGELAGPLTHEINNVLNTIALHLAAIQQTRSGDFAADLQTLRRQITSVAGLTMRFQRYRNRKMLEPGLVDLNASLRHVADAMPASSVQVPILLELDPALPKVSGYEADVRRLCRFLLANSVRALPAHGPAVVAKTAYLGGTVQLQVEDSGPDVPSEALPKFFEPGLEQREGMCSLELAACGSIVRRMNGTLQVQGRPRGGLVMTVTWPVMEGKEAP